MREYYLGIVALIAASAIIAFADDEIPTRCPEKDPMNTTIHLKHEYDCTKFYKCFRGKKYLMVCPYRDKHGNRLHFNPKLQVCDWPDPKICNDTIDDNWREPKVCPPDLDQCIRIRHKDCDKFYLCDHGREMVERCADGLHFNPETQMCDYPKNAGCEESCRWTCCPRKGSRVKVRLPHECSCKKYYICVDGDQIKRVCKRGKDFDSRRMRCVDPKEADCRVRPKVRPTAAITQCPEDERVINISHERNCDLYHKCVKGEMVLRKCQDGRNFNPSTGVCDYPENISCDVSACCSPKKGEVTPSPVPTDVSRLPEPEIKCPAEGDVKLPHKGDCSLYYVCQNGKWTIQACPAGLRFNEIISQCDWPTNVKCESQANSPLQSNAFESEQSEEDYDLKYDVVCIGECPYPDPKDRTVSLPTNDCTKFCQCSNGVAIPMDCPKGLHFDKKKQICNWPDDAKCESGLKIAEKHGGKSDGRKLKQ